jgi:hypothetical protein
VFGVSGHDGVFALDGSYRLNRIGAADCARARLGQPEVQNLTLLDSL